MKYTFIFLFLILFSCDNARVNKLEEENARLESQIDSIENQTKANLERTREIYERAIKERRQTMDSVIVARNMKVIRVNEGCAPNELELLLKSIKSIDQELSELDIEVIYTDLTECGYEFHHGSKLKIVEGIQNEEDLRKEIGKFFGIQL